MSKLYISRQLTFILLFMSLMCASGIARARSRDRVPEMKLQWDVKNLELYQHEPAIITLNLWTPEIEVVGAKETKSSSLNKGSFGYISKLDFDNRPRIVEQDGKRWYVYPIDAYVFNLDNAGKFRLSGGRYNIGCSFPVIKSDPFWGKVQSVETQVYELPVRPLDIKVKKLPDTSFESEFSGAVGDFEVYVNIPPGDIFVNEEAIGIITVRGPGWLSEKVLPEYRDAFGKNVKLKSFSENRQSYIQDGQLVSELQMECTFIPESIDDSRIGEVRIEYFNPATLKYEIAKSEPVKIKVVSIAKKAPAVEL